MRIVAIGGGEIGRPGYLVETRINDLQDMYKNDLNKLREMRVWRKYGKR